LEQPHLIEIDIFEAEMDEHSIKNIKEKIFKTKNGTNLLERLYYK
jgi:hypothetical protein